MPSSSRSKQTLVYCTIEVKASAKPCVPACCGGAVLVRAVNGRDMLIAIANMQQIILALRALTQISLGPASAIAVNSPEDDVVHENEFQTLTKGETVPVHQSMIMAERTLCGQRRPADARCLCENHDVYAQGLIFLGRKKCGRRLSKGSLNLARQTNCTYVRI
jgi:hypothetical protein